MYKYFHSFSEEFLNLNNSFIISFIQQRFVWVCIEKETR